MTKWTPEIVDELRALWALGTPQKKIATLLEQRFRIAFSNGSVATALTRLNLRGIERQGQAVVPKKTGDAPSEEKAPVTRRPPPHIFEVCKTSTCKYIAGEPSDRGFCGAPSVIVPSGGVGARSWCYEHLTVYTWAPKNKPKTASSDPGKYVRRNAADSAV